MRSAGVQTTG